MAGSPPPPRGGKRGCPSRHLARRFCRLVLPTPVQPKVLGRRVADDPFQGGGKPLGDRLNGVGMILVFFRADEIFDQEPVAKRLTDFASSGDKNGNLVLQGQEGQGLVGGSRPAEEIDKNP